METPPAALIIDTVPSQIPALYMAIGNAITGWQFVETALCDIFCKTSTCHDSKVASAIFYTFRDFAQKLDIARAAARISLSGNPLLDEFTSLRRRMRTASEFRNSLAHFHVTLSVPVGESVQLQVRLVTNEGEITGDSPLPTIPHSGSARFLLQPNSRDPNEQFRNTQDRQPTKKPMGINDVVKLIRLFVDLQTDLKAFSAKIRLPLALPE
jgi:hypothetical protein